MNMQWDTVHEPSELEVRQLMCQKHNIMLYPTIKNEQEATDQLRAQYVFRLRFGRGLSERTTWGSARQ